MKIRSSINLPWGHVRSHKKYGPDLFSRFDVYWSLTNSADRQVQTSKVYREGKEERSRGGEGGG